MPTERRAIVTPHLVLGVVALTAGVVLLAGNLGYPAARRLLAYWPAALVALGVAKLARARSLCGSIGGAFWAAAGLWLLGSNLGIVRVTVWEAAWTYWPLLLVGLGLSIVRQTLRRAAAGEALDRRSELRVVAILGGNKGSNGSQAFQGGELTAIMGGVNLDLTQARITASPAVIDVFTMWGGLELRVPEGWIIENRMVVALGGYEDRTRPVGNPEAPRLVLRGTTVMGGIEIRN